MSDYLKAAQKLKHARKKPPKAPAGWEPGVVWDGSKGVLVSEPTTERPKTWDDMLLMWGLDPEEVEVVGPVERRSWHGHGEDGVQLFHYWKARVQRRAGPLADIAELIKTVESRKKPTIPAHRGKATFLVLPADLQAGKYGTAEMVQGYKAMVLAQVERFYKLQQTGHQFGRIHIGWMGDLVENCAGYYPQQTFTVELDMRQQRRLTRHLVLWTTDQFAAIGLPLTESTAGGNHGENRTTDTGKSYTTFGDNSDIEVVETVAEACAQNPDAYGHVSFTIPDDELSFTLDLSGIIAGFAHGHQAGKGGSDGPWVKQRKWWVGQVAGMRPVGDAQLLYVAHDHTPYSVPVGPRWLHGCPTADMGSPWFEESYGLATKNGLLSMVVGKHLRHGWTDAWIA